MKWDEGKFLEAADGAARQDHYDRETKKWKRTTLPLVNFNIGIRENASLFEQNSEFETHLEQAVCGAGHFIALGRPWAPWGGTGCWPPTDRRGRMARQRLASHQSGDIAHRHSKRPTPARSGKFATSYRTAILKKAVY
ncbi:hypothetical protein [Rhizobium leguminosarum]|uniref:hypothetical protein n=1 Tax=Rhizobium leguminosarum TaxID=384 RepID=UPI001C94D1F8|nr:hypothetical protein [Rhizobium leguminosarum]MBY5351302.1 hypothetical protein [Rhizobium leguminosarum]